ncbi:papilin-like isoform X2 [Podarcis lilfordi]|uniref:Papilin-like isoform X2 n=1 Tax=Podarcis lilfordi TaxID=74358 RepID=A0AA35KI38_9SAUR|nr:papilin-like isoform X2 [Podarcis lilfordi]
MEMMKKKTQCTFLLVGLLAFWARVPPASAQGDSSSSEERPAPPAPDVFPLTLLPPPFALETKTPKGAAIGASLQDGTWRASSTRSSPSEERPVPLPTPPAMRCPTNLKDQELECGAQCRTHSNCPGEQMCCRYGCQQRCVLPVNVNPGYCPSSNPFPPTMCAIRCVDDKRCGKGKKCCRWGCLSSCVDAEPENPGVCPKIDDLRRFPSCPNICEDDRECDHTQKCCFTGCGRECVGLEKDLCNLPRDPGSCNLSLDYFYYHPRTKRCRRFKYSGCKGNSNRFYTRKDCMDVCGEVDICSLPMDPGRCKSYQPMFYYLPSNRTCQMFIYGGCEGNGNRFSTQEQCLRTCRNPDICKLPEDSGSCNNHKLSYYYNYANKTCERFTYRGCNGNENRFRTLEQCRSTCLYPEICKLPADPGPCDAYFPMFYYNHRNQSCLPFVYGGCGGNLNRFETLEGCQQQCRNPDICVLPRDSGPCLDYSRMYHYSPSKETCLPFPYGGCQGNANRFATMEECLDTCGSKDICKLPVDSGPCLALFPKFYYNPQNKTCEMFIYGGCGGNDNQFETQMECIWRCRNPDICKLPKETGPCKAAMPRYYYNPATKTCEVFVYGGCEGNENRFESLSECEHACKKPDICRLPSNPGEGDHSIHLFHYSRLGAGCYPFTYRGHKGNANRFATLVECEETCRDPDICQLPQKPGPCNTYVQRFYFNSTSRECTPFDYGNCRGNLNNFPTEEECQLACKGPEKPGFCPPPDPADCLMTCQKDCDCPGGKKCCGNQCGQVCKEPVKVPQACESKPPPPLHRLPDEMLMLVLWLL